MAHPHPLVSQARRALSAAFAQLPIGSAVLLAISGGADSMALAVSARYAARARAIELHSLTVDHGLRQESAHEARIVHERLTALGIAARVVRVHVGDASAGGAGQGPEGNARLVRYQALADEALRLGRERGAQAVPVFLGHNADDQAETVLLGLARGSGARSIAGMPRSGALPEHSDVPMVRPLLDMRSEHLRTVCRELDVAWVEDPTNQLTSEWRAADGSSLRRSALRYRVIPLLEEILGAGVVPALVRTGEMAAADDAALTQIARQALAASVTISNTAMDNPTTPSTAASSAAAPNAATPNTAVLSAAAFTAAASTPTISSAAIPTAAAPNTAALSTSAPTAAVPSAATMPSAQQQRIQISCAQLAAYPQAVRTRSLRMAALSVGARQGELFFSHISALDKLVTGRENNIRIDLPGAHAIKRRGVLEIAQGRPPGAAPE